MIYTYLSSNNYDSSQLWVRLQMFSGILPAILKPVSVLCGISSTPDANKSARGLNLAPPTALPANKPVTRCLSQASTLDSHGDSSSSSRNESSADEEVFARMAIHGRVARKAGRHVLRGGKLVLSRES